MYVELKSGYNDDGPAWIDRVYFSKAGQTAYFHGKTLRHVGGGGGFFIQKDVEIGVCIRCGRQITLGIETCPYCGAKQPTERPIEAILLAGTFTASGIAVLVQHYSRGLLLSTLTGVAVVPICWWGYWRLAVRLGLGRGGWWAP